MASTPPKLPKFIRLADQLRAQIQQMKPGDKLPTVADLRIRYAVSNATMDKVYNQLEAEGLIVRTQGSGVFVSTPRRRTGSGLIGFCGPADTPELAAVLAGVREAAHEAGRDVVLLHDRPGARWEQVDGVLLAQTYAASLLERLPPDTPAVVLLQSLPEANCIAVDDYQAQRAVTEHLLQLGHRRIACLQNEITAQAMHALAGYRDALTAAGVEPADAWVKRAAGRGESDGVVAGITAVQAWLESDWRELGCTGLVAATDELAAGAIEAFIAAGLDVPDDVSVAGSGDSVLGRYFTPRLTTLRVPWHDLGARGAQRLLELVETADGEPVQERVETLLIARESTAAPKA